MANTEPVTDHAGVVAEVREKAAAAGLADVFPVGAITKGLAGESLAEIGDMVEAGVRVFSDDGNCVPTARMLRNALTYAKAFPQEVVIADHCEDQSLVQGGHMHEGPHSYSLGLAGRPAEAEETMVARDIAMARMTGGRLHLCHLSSARSVDLVRAAKAEGVRVTAEVTPHHLVYTHDDLVTYDTNFKVNPPLRTRRGSRCAAGGGRRRHDRRDRHRPRSPRGGGEGIGVRPVAAGHDRTRNGARRGVDPSGVPGSDHRVARDRAMSVDARRASWARPVTAVRSSPGVPPTWCSSIPPSAWTVEPPFASRARNSAFTGAELTGRVRSTMLHGALTVADGKATR